MGPSHTPGSRKNLGGLNKKASERVPRNSETIHQQNDHIKGP